MCFFLSTELANFTASVSLPPQRSRQGTVGAICQTLPHLQDAIYMFAPPAYQEGHWGFSGISVLMFLILFFLKSQ